MEILKYYKRKLVDILDNDQPSSEKKSRNREAKDLKIKNILDKKYENHIKKYSDLKGFTLTLKPKFKCDETDDVFMHRYIENKILKSRVWKDKKYILFPEFTKNGDLHYHGVMWDLYEVEFMRCVKWWRRELGFVKPELKIKSPDNWWVYITKDYGKTGLWSIYKW